MKGVCASTSSGKTGVEGHSDPGSECSDFQTSCKCLDQAEIIRKLTERYGLAVL